MFELKLVSEEPPLGRGRLQIGEFTEEFEVVLEFWSADEYRQHWSEVLESMLNGRRSSALITSMTEPSTASFLVWWPIYAHAEGFVLQQQILFLNDLKFDPNDPAKHVPKRVQFSEDGERISEWQIDSRAIENFLRRAIRG